MKTEQKTQLINALKGLDKAVAELLPGAAHICCDIGFINDALIEGTRMRQMVEELDDAPKPDVYSIDPRLPQTVEMTTAMAIWEDAMDRMRNAHHIHGPTDIETIFEADGVCAARELFAAMALPMDQAWLIASHLGYDEPFDWEFVPAMMRELLPSIVANGCAVPDRRVWLMVLGTVVGHLGDVEQALRDLVEDSE